MLLFFDEARKRWGDAWPEKLAALVADRLRTKGEAWLASDERRRRANSATTRKKR